MLVKIEIFPVLFRRRKQFERDEILCVKNINSTYIFIYYNSLLKFLNVYCKSTKKIFHIITTCIVFLFLMHRQTEKRVSVGPK